MLTLTGQLLVPDAAESVRLTPGVVFVEGGRIARIQQGVIHPKPDFGGEDCIISPGFVDTHLHLPQFDSIGVDGLELLDWLNTAIFPAELRWADTDYAAEMSRRVALELLSFGTTGIAAYATSHHAAAQAAINTFAELGLAGHIGQVLMDQHAPAGLLVPASAALGQASTLKAKGRIAPAVTPRFAVSCSQTLLKGAGTLAARTGWFVQTHLSETRRECDLVQQLHPGKGSYTEIYDACGLLTPRTIFGHGIWLDDQERALLARKGGVIAHCPTANRFLDAGAMPRAKAVSAGVATCLGSDVGAGPDRSMVRVARAAIDAAKQVGAAVPNTAGLWWQITSGNARTIGLSNTGALEQERDADLLVIRPTTRWQTSPDPLSTLLYSWDDRWLRATLACGVVAYSA